MKHTTNTAIQLYKKGRLAAAKEICESILEQDTDNDTALHLLGVIIMKHGVLNEAIEYMEKAIRLNPSNAEYFHNCSYGYRQQGELDKARQYLQQSIKLKSNYGESYQALAELTRYTKKKWTAWCHRTTIKKEFSVRKRGQLFSFCSRKVI